MLPLNLKKGKDYNVYMDEIDEVLEACVEMSFLSKRNNLCRKIGSYLNFKMFDFTNLLEMLMVDVSINSEETFENGFRNGKFLGNRTPINMKIKTKSQ